LGFWVWGFGFGGLAPIPNPQSPIPNPQSPRNYKCKVIIFYIKLILLIIIKKNK